MKEQKMDDKRIQWHPAFFAGIQIELELDADNLIFENEHQLGTKPMEIDVLIIKKNSEIPVNKNIGRIFRKYNIIEYKSPDDYLSIDDFYKVYGYSCFYKADTENVNTVKVDEVTISFICSRYPRNLIRHLKEKRNYDVINVEEGIYHVIGDILPIQIIVTSRLTHEENIWLKSMTEEVEETTVVNTLIRLYDDNKKNPLYDSVMNLIVRTNKNKFEEATGMCEALEELFMEKMGQRIKEEAEIRAKEIAEIKVKEIAEIKAKEIAEIKAKEIAEIKAKEIAETKVKEAAKVATENAEKRINELIILLSKSGRIDDIVKAAQDKEYQNQLFKEFNL